MLAYNVYENDLAFYAINFIQYFETNFMQRNCHKSSDYYVTHVGITVLSLH